MILNSKTLRDMADVERIKLELANAERRGQNMRIVMRCFNKAEAEMIEAGLTSKELERVQFTYLVWP